MRFGISFWPTNGLRARCFAFTEKLGSLNVRLLTQRRTFATAERPTRSSRAARDLADRFSLVASDILKMEFKNYWGPFHNSASEGLPRCPPECDRPENEMNSASH